MNQTIIDHIEVIIVSNGLTESFQKKVEKYIKAFSNIKLICNDNGCSSAESLTIGLKYAIGDYVAFLDADDTVPNDAYETMFNSAVKSNADIVLGKSEVLESSEASRIKVLENQTVFSKEHSFDDIQNYPEVITFFSYCGKLFNRQFILQSSIVFIEEITFFEDMDFTIPLLCLAKQISIVPSIVHYYRRLSSDEYKLKTEQLTPYEYIIDKLRTLELVSSCINKIHQSSDIKNFVNVIYLLEHLNTILKRLKTFPPEQQEFLAKKIHNILSGVPESAIEHFAKNNFIVYKLIKYGQYNLLQKYYDFVKKQNLDFWKHLKLGDNESFWLYCGSNPLFKLKPLHIGEIESIQFNGRSIIIQGYSFIAADVKHFEIYRNIVISNNSGTQKKRFIIKSIQREDVMVYGEWIPVDTGFYLRVPLNQLMSKNLNISMEYTIGLSSYTFKLPSYFPMTISSYSHRIFLNKNKIKIQRFSQLRSLIRVIKRFSSKVMKWI